MFQLTVHPPTAHPDSTTLSKAYLANPLLGAMPLTSVDGSPVGGGRIGRHTERLRAALMPSLEANNGDGGGGHWVHLRTSLSHAKSSSKSCRHPCETPAPSSSVPPWWPPPSPSPSVSRT